MTDLDNWLTATQIMVLIGWKSRSTVLSMGRKYGWRKVRAGWAWLYWRPDVEEYVQQRLSGEVQVGAGDTLRPER